MNDDDRPSLLVMMGAVALAVVLVILLFGGIGYLLGRVFL